MTKLTEKQKVLACFKAGEGEPLTAEEKAAVLEVENRPAIRRLKAAIREFGRRELVARARHRRPVVRHRRIPRRASNLRRRRCPAVRTSSPRGDLDPDPEPWRYSPERQKWGGTAQTARPRHRGASLGATGRLTACPFRPVAPPEQKERHEHHDQAGLA